MSNFQRILNMASKALDKSGHSTTNGSGNADWRQVVRAAADRVTGDTRPAAAQPGQPAQPASATRQSPARPTAQERPANPEDAAAIARYDYLLKTAQPEQLEQVHRDAFARLTPAQRDQVNATLRAELPASEHPASAEPGDLARAAARGEAHNPGFLRGLFAKKGGRGPAGALAGAGLGAAGGLLAAVAGGAVLSSVAAPILEQAAGLGVDFENLAGGLGGLTAGAEDYVGAAGDQLGELGSTFEAPTLSDLASNFEIPGLDDFGRFFGRES